jgi:hypothetical protein
MTTLLRYADLKKRGIVRSWAQLRRLQDREDFPLGKLLSPNCRIWDDEEEIIPWVKSRPTKRAQLRGAAKAKHERKAAQSEAEA